MDPEKLVITIPFELLEFLRLPFGLENTSKTFQRFINEATNKLQDVFAYADDILFVSNDLVDHINALAELFNRLEKFRIQIKFKNCQWKLHGIDFLRYTIISKGIKPQTSRPSENY